MMARPLMSKACGTTSRLSVVGAGRLPFPPSNLHARRHSPSFCSDPLLPHFCCCHASVLPQPCFSFAAFLLHFCLSSALPCFGSAAVRAPLLPKFCFGLLRFCQSPASPLVPQFCCSYVLSQSCSSRALIRQARLGFQPARLVSKRSHVPLCHGPPRMSPLSPTAPDILPTPYAQACVSCAGISTSSQRMLAHNFETCASQCARDLCS